ncbi:hypothetical protein Rsub_12561 [Raphidocelis subcapitata]|uniref:Uncharacterized protein n=1 Tax=Raphidocelis subcapitata TaxID=307507 RepID=A0A2V0PJ35_9CHLO|nr:hypothetical protein Rsub_12561 [Raphidocelis subcapitata]|eukprot:GBF99808.1 hypothetical protein Rsub_12561 [Raphidocelis subcapitata]
MALRTLVTGSDMCSGSDGAGPSNAVGALVNQLLGGAGKTQEQLRDLPMHYAPPPLQRVPLTPEAAAAAAAAGPSGMQLPGFAHAPMPPSALDALLGGPPRLGGQDAVASMVAEFERMAAMQPGPQGAIGPQPGPLPPGGAPAVEHNLRAFFAAAASRTGLPAQLAPLPPGALSVAEQVRIRDRSTILARQVYADQGQGFADSRVAELLGAMGVDAARLPAGLPHVHDESWHALWAAQQQAGPPQPMAAADLAANMEAAWREQQQHRARPWQLPHAPSTGWAEEFAAQAHLNPSQQQQQQPASWAEEFTHGEGEKWAGEFDAAAAAATSASDARAADPAEAVAASRRMVEVLSADADPKMRNSQFLQFLSKMSRGELLLDEGGLREADPEAAAAARQWADEFEATRAAGGGTAAAWADDFARQQQAAAGPGPQRQRDWADEFAAGVADFQISAPEDPATAEELDAAWAEIGSGAVPLAGAADWVREFGGGDGAAGPAEWDELFERAQAEAAAGLGAPLRSAGRRDYVFADPNPFLGDAAALAKGKELFKRGLLTEAALALEAEVRANPRNAEAWRLLGTVHAENDDDVQAIAAMGKALEADPTDPAVLLSLGVSHTNELDQAEAVGYLSSWLAAHPTYAPAAAAAGAPPDRSQVLSHALRTFTGLSRAHASDAELLIATGVLQHLARDYDGAIASFRAALELAPGDYSLWNKLGATLANHSHSGEAISAYQRALDLKPNYMRAWTNMGVAYANVGDYARSAAFYARALGLNPGADHVWGYLRTSLACAGQQELMAAADSKDLATLQARLPL